MSNSTGFAGLSPKTPKTVTLNSAAASIDIIPLKAGFRIRVIAAVFTISATGTLLFNDTTAADADTEIGRLIPAAAETIVLPHNPDGWLETTAGNKLNIGNAGTLTLSGTIRYVYI